MAIPFYRLRMDSRAELWLRFGASIHLPLRAVGHLEREKAATEKRTFDAKELCRLDEVSPSAGCSSR